MSLGSDEISFRSSFPCRWRPPCPLFLSSLGERLHYKRAIRAVFTCSKGIYSHRQRNTVWSRCPPEHLRELACALSGTHRDLHLINFQCTRATDVGDRSDARRSSVSSAVSGWLTEEDTGPACRDRRAWLPAAQQRFGISRPSLATRSSRASGTVNPDTSGFLPGQPPA